MKKKILWKSDLWGFTLLFCVMALFLGICAISHFWERRPGDAFGALVAMALPFIIALVLAFTDSDELARSLRPEIVKKAAQEARKDSFLDWNNIPPDKRDPPPGTLG